MSTQQQQSGAVSDAMVITWRNLKRIPRIPELAIFAILQSIMFVLLFAFVFGAAIDVPGASYKEFLLPGIMGQTMMFTAFIVASGLTGDLEKGIIDRFRSLPIRRSSVLVGRALASLLHSSIGIVVMALTGLLIGWRIRTSLLDGVIGFALVLLFGCGMIWFGILVGSWLRSVEAVNGFLFSTLFPLSFLSNAFVPTEPMPDVLEVIAEWNPMSALVQALRISWGNGPEMPDAALPLQYPVLATIIWSVALTATFAPFALRAYNRRTAD